MINASTRLAAANEAYTIDEVIGKVLKLSPQYGVGQGAYAYSTMVPADEAPAVLRKLKQFKFKAAKWNRQLLPIAKAEGAKLYVTWVPDLARYATATAPGWATFMIVVPESTGMRFIFQPVTFKPLPSECHENQC